MKYRNFIFLCITFATMISFQPFEVVEAVNYDTEIGLTFQSDVAAGTDSSTSITSESSTETTSQSSDNTPGNKKHFPETGIKRIDKNNATNILPSTGSKKNTLYLVLGSFILIIVFALIGFKTYKARHE